MAADPTDNSAFFQSDETPDKGLVGAPFKDVFDRDKHNANTQRALALILIILTGVFYTFDFFAVLFNFKTIDDGLRLIALFTPIQASATTIIGFYYVLPRKGK
jgi:hypothetical protein